MIASFACPSVCFACGELLNCQTHGEGRRKKGCKSGMHTHLLFPFSFSATTPPITTAGIHKADTYLERQSVTRRKHRPNPRPTQPPEGANVSLCPAGVDHDEGDEEATEAVEEGKGVVVAFVFGEGVEEMRGKKRAMSGL